MLGLPNQLCSVNLTDGGGLTPGLGIAPHTASETQSHGNTNTTNTTIMATIDPTNSMPIFVLGMVAFVAICYILTIATSK